MIAINLRDGSSQSVSRAWCEMCAESASVVFESMGLEEDLTGQVEGDSSAKVRIRRLPVTTEMRRTYGDLDDATEDGAYGLAIWLVPLLSDYKCYSRSNKGTGFDYWLIDKWATHSPEDELNFITESDARMEVSGIRKGSRAQLNSRVKQKKDQLSLSDLGGKPGYVFVVEYSSVEIRWERKAVPPQ